jgi:hypothetical protein
MILFSKEKIYKNHIKLIDYMVLMNAMVFLKIMGIIIHMLKLIIYGINLMIEIIIKKSQNLNQNML